MGALLFVLFVLRRIRQWLGSWVGMYWYHPEDEKYVEENLASARAMYKRMLNGEKEYISLEAVALEVMKLESELLLMRAARRLTWSEDHPTKEGFYWYVRKPRRLGSLSDVPPTDSEPRLVKLTRDRPDGRNWTIHFVDDGTVEQSREPEPDAEPDPDAEPNPDPGLEEAWDPDRDYPIEVSPIWVGPIFPPA